MEDHRRNKLIAVGVAILLPIAVTRGVSLFVTTATAMAAFYCVVGIGAIAAFLGARCSVAGCNSGFFWGGLLTVVLHYYNNWSALDGQAQFIAALSAITILTLVAHRRNRPTRAAAKKRRR